METHEAIDWLRKRMAWERWLTELHNSPQDGVEVSAEVENLAQRRLPAVLTSDWWNRRSA
jgi:hypothetical protein